MKDKIKNQANTDFNSFFSNVSDEKDESYEKALSQSLKFGMAKFDDTSETSKYDSKAMAILSVANPTMKELCEAIILKKKDYKRKRSKEWKEIIKSIAKSINKEKNDDNKGFFPFLKR